LLFVPQPKGRVGKFNPVDTPQADCTTQHLWSGWSGAAIEDGAEASLISDHIQ